jgi:hypothetical protein
MERLAAVRIPSWGLASLLALTLSFPVLPQIGYPGGYPGGGYPGGGYPYPGGGGGIGGPGLPIPHRKKKKDKTAKDAPEPLTNVTGILRQLDDKSVVVEAQDTRIISLKRTEKTKFFNDAKEAKPADFKPGDHVQIEATQDVEGFFFAVNVILEKPGTAAERAAAARPVEVSTQASQDDEERPILRRKDAPAKRETAQPSAEASPSAGSPPAAAEASPSAAAPEPPRPATQRVQPIPEDADAPHLKRGWSKVYKPGDTAPPTPARPREVAAARRPASPEAAHQPEGEPAAPPNRARAEAPAEPAASSDPVIEKARAAAGSFTKTLPNYVCQEMMARFVNTSHIVSWQPLDVVSTEVVYEDGRERYRNVAVNGKLTKKRIEDLPGSWSTGEFGTVLVDLFSASTAADFTFRGESTSGGQAALVYDFDVDRENSHWHIQVASQVVMPAYSGAVWIDKQTRRVLRIEMQARRMPQDFPLDKVESATDYQYIHLGESQFLLPVHAESLSCQRGTSLCARNTIDFRNYHKYSADSEIIFGKGK